MKKQKKLPATKKMQTSRQKKEQQIDKQKAKKSDDSIVNRIIEEEREDENGSDEISLVDFEQFLIANAVDLFNQKGSQQHLCVYQTTIISHPFRVCLCVCFHFNRNFFFLL